MVGACTPAITTRGLKENEMGEIVELIDDVLSHLNDTTVVDKVRAKVNNMMSNRPLFAW